MKRTNVQMSRLISGLSAGLFYCLMLMMFSVNQSNAQSFSPLPTLKAKADVQQTVTDEIEQLRLEILKYGTNRPQGDPTYDRLMMLWDAYHLIENILLEPTATPADAVTTVYPVLQKAKVTHSVANMDGFYNHNWPSIFTDIVDRLKL